MIKRKGKKRREALVGLICFQKGDCFLRESLLRGTGDLLGV